ncbi:MAG: class I SAM-dependent methyltransferase [Chloroflexi bacterium]|nr:class I SAM-dependent methyltransferase [Chloroflexota bacterium]
MIDFDRFARFYDYEYGEFDADIPMYRGFAERAGSPILELACGTGRLLIPLARAGFQVTGIDISEAMLNIARSKAEAAGVQDRVSLIRAEMQEFTLDQRFHMALCALNSFMHLKTQAEQLAALRCWRHHLRPGGLLIIDLFPPYPERLAERDRQLIVQHIWDHAEGGVTIVKQQTQQVDFAEQQIHVHFIYDEVSPDGAVRRTLAPFIMRYLGRFEMELLLDKAGYAIEAIYGSWDLDPFESESERMIFVARRREGDS